MLWGPSAYHKHVRLPSAFEPNRLSRCCERHDILSVSLKGVDRMVIWESSPLSATVDPVLYPQQTVSEMRASAWQSVWIVLNVDINQDTVLDSCHPGSPQLWCQIPLQWSQKERDTLLWECASLSITQFTTDVLADALVKKYHNASCWGESVCRPISCVYGTWQR